MKWKRKFNVFLSKKARGYELMFLMGCVVALFGITWIIITASMDNNILVIAGLVILGIGIFAAMLGGREYSAEYNICVMNSKYVNELLDEDEKRYRIVQNGHGEILEINYRKVVMYHKSD